VQHTPYSLLAPGLRGAWQQQQHADLARAAGSSSSSDGILEVWMPQLLSALLRPITYGEEVHDNEHAIRFFMQLADDVGTAAAGGVADADGAAELQAVASYALTCLADAACRASLACWVLTWHVMLVQQGGDYHSAASR
jgi:hypothetical protein